MVVDVDGTLVDSVYQHVIAWDRALTRHGVRVPLRRIHRHIGMGGDLMVAALGGEGLEREHGDDVRAAEGERYRALLGEVRPLPGARALLRALAARYRVVLSSSAREPEAEHYVDLLEARGVVHAWTTSADVEVTKPHPDLVEAALRAAGCPGLAMVGDATQDCEAAARAGLPTVGVTTGGLGADELRGAGAVAVVDDLVRVPEQLARLEAAAA